TGPYQEVSDVFNDQAFWAGGKRSFNYTPWDYIVVPLPERVWMTGEFAESAGAYDLSGLAKLWSSKKGLKSARAIADLISQGKLRMHTYVTTSNGYKAGLDARGFDPDLARAYRLARWPYRVWVVEAVDRDKREAGDPNCIIGEAIYDATSTDQDSYMLAAHVPGAAWVRTTESAVFPLKPSVASYQTGGSGSA